MNDDSIISSLPGCGGLKKQGSVILKVIARNEGSSGNDAGADG